jgi:putative ABC transport system permease protein
MIESALLCVAGGAAGLALAFGLHRALPWMLPADFPRLDAVIVDGRVLLVGLALSLVASVACALLPAVHAWRVNLAASLAEGAGSPSGGGLRSKTARARTIIMAGQVAVACVLLAGAVLLSRSFITLRHADRGYDPVNLLTARIPIPPTYTIERRAQLVDVLVDRLRVLPGVARVAAGNALPFASSGGFVAFAMPSPRDPGVQLDVQAIQRIVTPDYFKVLGLHLVEGRTLAETDTASAQPVVVVNRSFARTYLPPRPIGVRIRRSRAGSAGFGFRDGQSDWEVVGVVDDMRQDDVEAPLQPELFATFQQVAPASIRNFDPILAIKAVSDPRALVPSLRDAVRREAPSLALDSVMTMEDRVMTSLARPRTYALLFSGFAVFALTIAGVGLFGVLSYSVAQRSREIGVRSALGARPRDIVALVLRQAMVIASAGLIAGLAVAAAAARVLSTFLYGVTTHDAWSFATVPVAVGLVAVVACVVPARRAARLDPLTALRSP